MKKLRFKNRNGVLYFGVGDKFKSSKMKYNTINKNIIMAKFRDGLLNDELFEKESVRDVMINDLINEVIKNKSIALKHKSIITYKSVFINSIHDYFDGMSVVSVRATDIRKWHEHLINKGLKRQTITIARVLLKEAFDIAMIDEIVETNPIKIVDMPKMKSIKKKHKPFTLDEIDLLLASSDGFVKNFLGISFFTGMRSGELLALRWDDVDFTTDTISITKTIAEGIINEPKTNSSYREIEMLDKAKEFFKSQRLQTGLKNEYVFLNSNGAYYGNNSTIYYKYCTLLKELGLEHRSLHNTRHTFASIMLNNGIEPMWVSNTLGHENLDITLKIYAHFMPRKEKMSIKFLEKRYKSGTM